MTSHEDVFSPKASPYHAADFKEDRLAQRDSEPSWTTSRCHRLLRPLASKIALLRKLKGLGSKELRNSIADSSLGFERQSSWNLPTNTNSSQGSESSSTDIAGMDDTSSWLADSRPRKRLRRTYSSKSSVKAPASNAVGLPNQARETSADDILRLIDEHRSNFHNHLRDDYGGLALHGLSDDEQEKLPYAPVESIEWEVGCGQKTPLRGAFTKLARNLSPVNWRTLDGFYDGLVALLKATADSKLADQRQRTSSIFSLQKPAMRDGSRSLFATCLRRMPQYIKEEQLSATNDDPESDVDISSTMYNHLEQMNTSNTGGWRPLKDVVRAHGIAMLVAAIEESLINLPLARALMLLCLEQGAPEEAARIVEAMVAIMKPLPKPETSSSLLFSFRTSMTLQTMHAMWILTKCSRFEYAQLAKLFDSSVIPFDWIGTPDMVDCWTRAIISATQGTPEAPEASLLLRTVMAKASVRTGLPFSDHVHELRLRTQKHRRRLSEHEKESAKKLIQTSSRWAPDIGEEEASSEETSSVLSNLLTVLCAISLIESSRTSALTHIGQEAWQMSDLRIYDPGQPHVCGIDHDQLSLSLMASALATHDVDHRCLRSFTRGLLETTPRFPVMAGLFLCSVAECYGRVAPKDAFKQLQDLIQRLGYKVAGHLLQNESCGAILNAVYINAAFKVAERSGQPKHFEGALALEQRLPGRRVEHALRTPGKTPAHCREESRSGFRWEEGICEWVAQSPEVAQKLQREDSGTMVVEAPSTEENVVHLAHPLVKNLGNPSEQSPCARRDAAQDVQGFFGSMRSMQSDTLIPVSGSFEAQGRPRRGRPRRMVAQQRSHVQDKDELPVMTTPHEPHHRVQQRFHRACATWKIRPIVLVEKVDLGVLFRAEGTVKSTSRTTTASSSRDVESEDELCLL
ncbi:MAG: hypothetical protein HETSPECPRED_008751 [Heterodermia speciosa]|uniref:Uncharacterized protein n=1 Tax=Heterodermia speciosa TaxID=116794 RepID=A0A8H3IA75_9LECA|nr:MAG: hypothetical protein HETSPECPRED_008751 [Heterodermia speciosa]